MEHTIKKFFSSQVFRLRNINGTTMAMFITDMFIKIVNLQSTLGNPTY